MALFGIPAPAGFAADRLPDLAMAPLRDIYVQTTSDGRRLLRFTTIIVNRGEPFELRGTRSTTSGEMSVVQHIYQTTGGYRTVSTPAKMFWAQDGHNHWHVRDLQVYELIRLDNGVKVGTGAKRGFCFYDNYEDNLTLPGAPQYPQYTTCGTSSSALGVTMGLSKGWGDIYPHNIAFQYIDISAITSGRYLLKATADPLDWFPELSPTNNSTSTELQLTGSSSPTADLSASISDSPDPVAVGADLTYTITVRNGGTSSASDVRVSDTIPAGTTYISASPSQGSCSGTSTVSCSLGSLGNGATATVRLVVRPSATGTLSNSATVSTTTTDPSSTNNTATATTTVNSTSTPTTVTAFPGSVYLYTGSVRAGDFSRLGANDNSFYQVNSSGGVTYWYGRFYGVPNGLRNLRVTYSGLSSLTCSQNLRIWSWTYGYWVSLDTRSVGSTEIALTATPGGTLANYVSGSSGNGDVAVGVRCSASTSFFTSADLLQITYDT